MVNKSIWKESEATNLECFIRERFKFKQFYDNYLELRYVEDRFHLTKGFVRECSEDLSRAITNDVIDEVTQSIINYMEDEVRKVERRPYSGMSL